MAEDGVRAIWFGYKVCDEAMLDCLHAARVNTVMLSCGFHDLLDLDTARWKDGELIVEPKETVVQRLLAATNLAAGQGIHVFWMTTYELEQMLPHLERLGYDRALVEGPTRFVPTGPKKDAAALDRTFWRGITGAHGELIARLSTEHPIEGILYDTEHYAGGIMYLQGCGFADVSFAPFLASRKVGQTASEIPAGTRYHYLKKHGLLRNYFGYLEELAYEQGRYLAERWRAINPHLVLGAWPMFDNWFAQGLLRGLGGAAPSLGLSGVEYYNGADQSASMAEFFESRNRNLLYMPGFYPPVAYTTEQLEYHVGQALRSTNRYWMLSAQKQLRKAEYQAALRKAHQQSATATQPNDRTVNLQYRVEELGAGPVLIVETEKTADTFKQTPHLTLRATLGGAPLCKDVPMTKTEKDKFAARVSLLRRLTHNRHLGEGFRAGVSYRLDPQPLAFMYEDPYHTKLVDGRAWGLFGTTVAWPETVDKAEVVFDLHRPYRIEKVELAQPYKLEDGVGGPSRLTLDFARQDGEWEHSAPFVSDFRLTGSDHTGEPSKGIEDKRHSRAWLSWRIDSIERTARWLRVRMERIKPRHTISLGEVVIWGRVDCEVQASVREGDRTLRVRRGKRHRIGTSS